jgi:hypothetical protein
MCCTRSLEEAPGREQKQARKVDSHTNEMHHQIMPTRTNALLKLRKANGLLKVYLGCNAQPSLYMLSRWN